LELPPADLLEHALAARSALLRDPQTTACRVWHGAGDGIPGLVMERLGDVLVVQCHEGRLRLPESAVRELCEEARRRLGLRAVYRKIFPRDRNAVRADLTRLHCDPQPWLGEAVPAELTVLEAGVRFLVRPYDGFATGLFLEHRTQRDLVRRLSAGRRVLNGFAHTCGFSVAAALGGAAETVSVDVSVKALEWGKRNFAANALDLKGHWFYRSDVLEYYRRAVRQERTFDLVILDPPTFSRDKRSGRVFVAAEHLAALVAGALPLLAPGGRLLLSTNHRGTARAALGRIVRGAAGGRPCGIESYPELPVDFPGDPDYAKSVLARLD